MPYKDPDVRRQYDRERKQLVRAGEPNTSPVQIPPAMRVRVIDDVLALLERAISLVEGDGRARDIEKGRTLASIASISLRAVETHDLAARLEALEGTLNQRRAG